MHVCTVCKKEFKRKDNLTQHKKIHSTDKEIIKCNSCQKSFSRHSNLRRHQKNHCVSVVEERNEDEGEESNISQQANRLENDNLENDELSQLMDDTEFVFDVNSIPQQQQEQQPNTLVDNEDLSQLMDDENFEFDVNEVSSQKTNTCYYCKKVFKRADNCKLHQKHCRKRKYPNCNSSSSSKKSKRVIQVGYGDDDNDDDAGNLPQLISTALDGATKVYRKTFQYDENVINHMDALQQMTEVFQQLLTNESQQQDLKSFLSISLSFHQASDEDDVTDPPVTLRSNVFVVQHHSTDIVEKVNDALNEIKQLIDDFERNGSGWVLHQLHYLDLGKILSNRYAR